MSSQLPAPSQPAPPSTATSLSQYRGHDIVDLLKDARNYQGSKSTDNNGHLTGVCPYFRSSLAHFTFYITLPLLASFGPVRGKNRVMASSHFLCCVPEFSCLGGIEKFF